MTQKGTMLKPKEVKESAAAEFPLCFSQPAASVFQLVMLISLCFQPN